MRPFHAIFAVVVFSIFTGLSAHSQNASSAVGIISKASGQVFLERGTAKIAARLADLLYPGDKILTAAGQAVFLFCPSLDKIATSENSTVELGPGVIKILRGKAPLRTTAKCQLPQVALGNESMERIGGLRVRGELPISMYIGGAVMSSRPTFCWAPVEKVLSYRLTLRAAHQDTVMWATSTPFPNAAYPESLPGLERAHYEWEVQAEANGKILARGTAAFEVRPTRALPLTSDIPADSKLLHAIGLENEGYYAEAASHFRELRDTEPEDARLTRHLAWLYQKAGLVMAANDELKRLNEKSPRYGPVKE
jgi:hypothetical protein